MNETPTKKQATASLISFVTVFVLAMYFFILLVAPYLMALFIGMVLALLAYPIHKRLLPRIKNPVTTSAIVTLLVILVVVTPILIFSSMALKQGIALGKNLAEFDQFTSESISYWLQRFGGPIRPFLPEETRLNEQIDGMVRGLAKSVLDQVVFLAKSIPEAILQIFLACLTCFFLLIDGPRFFVWLYTRVPLELEIRNKLAVVFKDTAISVIWASMVAAGAQALIMVVAYTTLGVPAAFLAGGATFILAWIPIVGSTPVWVIGGIYLYLQGEIWKVAAMLIFGAVTGLSDNFIRPWILKGRGEMHPLVSLVAIFGGIQMFGLFGVFIGPIVAALVISLLQIWPVIGHRMGLKFDGRIATPYQNQEEPQVVISNDQINNP